MPSFAEITSPQNPRVKDLARLKEGKHRRRMGVYAIEGIRELERAIAGGAEIVTLYFCEDCWLGDEYAALVEGMAQKPELECFRMSLAAFEKASNRENPDGLIAVARMRRSGLADLKLGQAPLIMLIEHVEKPGNLGTLLRSADAAGADAVIVTDPVTDLYSPQAIRASQGSIFAMQTVFADNAQAKAFFKERGIHAVAATPDAERLLWDTDMKAPVALLLGSEADGLSDFWMKDADTVRAKIPMSGKSADSLNVSAAAAIFLFEAVRQRR
ncbi:MAG: RNA methyltransferase [Opitutales bacterium]|nr:RNA methyltransferase [Opitutales bacterium]